MRTRLLMFLAGVLLIGLGVYLPFYIGHEVFPDGWASTAKRWWTLPTMLLFGVVVLPSAFFGILAFYTTVCPHPSDDEPEEENEGQTQV
jgi:hypothetical protein